MRRVTLSYLAGLLERSSGIRPAVEWVQRLRWTTWPTGHRSRFGRVRVSAPGYRTKIMMVDQDPDGVSIT